MSTISYTVKYKANRAFSRWVTIENVIGDGFVNDRPLRFFKKINNEIVYIPHDFEVLFSKERELSIVQAVAKEVGR